MLRALLGILLLSFPVEVTINQLADSSWDGSEIEIRGFLYPQSEHQWILSSEPALKTCCVASRDLVQQQIFISGDFSHVSYGQAVVLRGTFLMKPRWDDQGRLLQMYVLEGASMVQRQKWPLWTFAGMALVVIGMIGGRKWTKKDYTTI